MTDGIRIQNFKAKPILYQSKYNSEPFKSFLYHLYISLEHLKTHT